jgi:hypothetical protein
MGHTTGGKGCRFMCQVGLHTCIPEQPAFLGGKPLLSGVIHVVLVLGRTNSVVHVQREHKVICNTHLHLCDVELKQLNLDFPVVENSIGHTS